ncbi:MULTISPECIES: AraC family transcriptional regulator [unclassified Paenibacillus]|uniref:AraC family transcriptional regulator n=1 Tax=unclassified Paenibacillus TaxID=185978 RepID=UPI001AE96CF6|nr:MULTISPECIES: AraC family transcriptional regulator [unclassified Paenibacillus]MBP1154653.1 AraC-like DNA-binding protein [Paenibacillus sp. PvP091]MBP1169963.1 AraC-like DNA-binding protein [Paenibacillus sp. PvR098]MBP2440991.1 AraC-like DNA-binding protein [Paenibacillus sp. PvP052]
MSILQFTAPPLPYYIVSDYTLFQPGQKHLNRRNIGVFDLLVVTSGCIYIGEEDQRYEISAGHALILRPDRYHYPTEACRAETRYYWLHFNTTGSWGSTESADAAPQGEATNFSTYTMQTFTMAIPQFVKLLQPTSVYDMLQQLTELERKSHNNWARWKHQLMFQNILEQLNASFDLRAVMPGTNVADRAASYLRMHYKEDITAQTLGEAMNFHPVYIARCMQKEFGCSPFEYLMRYRLEQAKLLLLQTDLQIARIAEDVGFHQPSYFSSSFTKYEGLSPREYRRGFRNI